MVHLATILHRTPANIHRNSQTCRAKIESATINADRNGSFWFVKLTAFDPRTTRKRYRLIIKLYLDPKTGKVATNPKTFVWCGCKWFLYNCEVALALRGSSFIVNSNGALPKITNSTGRPQACKHCLAALRLVRSAPMALELADRKTKTKTLVDDIKLNSKMNGKKTVASLTDVDKSQMKDSVGEIRSKQL